MSSDKVQKNDAYEEKPPYSNRGVLNTSQVVRGSLRACVDWLQATLTFFCDVEINIKERVRKSAK